VSLILLFCIGITIQGVVAQAIGRQTEYLLVKAVHGCSVALSLCTVSSFSELF
jgi:hypothetical protein